MMQLDGDSGPFIPTQTLDEASMLSPFVNKKKQNIEFRHPITNEVFLSAPYAEADLQMRRLTNLVDQQDEMTQQNAQAADLSKSYEEEESTIVGQKTDIVKSILRKMLDHQTETITRSVRNDSSYVADIKWNNEEMTALTEIFKDIVLGDQFQSRKSCSNQTQRVKLHPSQWSCDLSARNQILSQSEAQQEFLSNIDTSKMSNKHNNKFKLNQLLGGVS